MKKDWCRLPSMLQGREKADQRASTLSMVSNFLNQRWVLLKTEQLKVKFSGAENNACKPMHNRVRVRGQPIS